MAIIGGVVYKKSMIFEVFREYLCEFFIFLSNKHQNFDEECSSYAGDQAQSPDLADFDDLGHFSGWLFWHKPLALGHRFFLTKNQFNAHTLTCSKRAFHESKL